MGTAKKKATVITCKKKSRSKKTEDDVKHAESMRDEPTDPSAKCGVDRPTGKDHVGPGPDTPVGAVTTGLTLPLTSSGNNLDDNNVPWFKLSNPDLFARLLATIRGGGGAAESFSTDANASTTAFSHTAPTVPLPTLEQLVAFSNRHKPKKLKSINSCTKDTPRPLS